jgi:hypothetical protein
LKMKQSTPKSQEIRYAPIKFRTICDKKETYKAQAAVANPSSKIIRVRTQTMEKMEKLLLLWIRDFDQRGIPVSHQQFQLKLYHYFNTSRKS